MNRILGKILEKWLVVFIACFFGLACLSGKKFSSDALTLRINDESGAPIKDVLVVVLWEMEKGELHGSTKRYFHRMEAVSDDHGLVKFGSWGPERVPFGWQVNGTSPSAFVLSEGREGNVASNFAAIYGKNGSPGRAIPGVKVVDNLWQHAGPNIVAAWNGETVTLRRAPNNKAYWQALDHLLTVLEIYDQEHAVLKSLPIFRQKVQEAAVEELDPKNANLIPNSGGYDFRRHINALYEPTDHKGGGS